MKLIINIQQKTQTGGVHIQKQTYLERKDGV